MYTTQADVEAYLKRVLSTSESQSFSLMLAAVQTYIDNETGNSFGDVSATTRYYNGGSEIIDIDPCTNVTAVKLVDSDLALVYTYTEHEEFELYPLNQTYKTYIRNRYDKFPLGLSRIAVTAKFSGGEVPDDIKFVATVMTASLITEGMNGKLASESIEGYSKTFAVSVEKGELSTKKELIDTILSKYSGGVLI